MIFPHLNILADWNWMLPKGSSNLAPDVDNAWKLILLVTGFFFCVVVGAMTFFVIKYRRRTPNDVTSTVTHNTPLEIVWTGVPLVLVVGFFYVGFRGFLHYDTPQSNCIIIDVEAKKWKFTFTYPNGAQDGNLYLQQGVPVRLNLHSIDVLHAIYLPNFRTQRNLVPGRQTTLWFIPEDYTPTKAQTDPKTNKTTMVQDQGWPIFCTQYCGDGHSRMFAHVFVMATADFEDKMKELANPFTTKEGSKKVFVPYVTLGQKLYNQIGCSTCHNVDGKPGGTGPTWQGLWKRDHEPFAYSNVPGYTLMASDPDDKWEAYIKESIIDPDAKLVRFGGVNYHGMSSFASQLSGSATNDERRRAITDYIKSIGNTGWKPDINSTDNPDLYDADNPKLVDASGLGIHPESLAGIEARKKLGLVPGAQSQPATQSQPASQSRPGN